jgi:hypothetical protein
LRVSVFLTKHGLRKTTFNTIVESLLESIDARIGLGLRHDWKAGKNSSFRTPIQEKIRTDDLIADFSRFLQEMRTAGQSGGCLICVDEGQRIHSFALSALRNALQAVGSGYMLILALRNDASEAVNAVEGPRIIEDLARKSEDSGLPRLFEKSYISLGPFDTSQEAEECIRKRLIGQPVKFNDAVISNIGKVTGRYPRTMMLLANEIYTAAEESGTEADESILRQAFITAYKDLVDEAGDYCTEETNTRKAVCKNALAFENTFTALQVANGMLTGTISTVEVTDFAADPVSIALERLVQGKYCVRLGSDQFQWSDPLRTYALRIALG